MTRPGLRRRLVRDRPATQAWWSPAGGQDLPDLPESTTVTRDGAAAAGPQSLEDVDTGPLPVLAGVGTGPGRRPRAARPGALRPLRAVLGAAVAVCGVLLGIGTLLWATAAPAGDPALRPPPQVADGGPDVGSEPAVALPADDGPAGSETAPVDPVPLDPVPAQVPVAQAPVAQAPPAGEIPPAASPVGPAPPAPPAPQAAPARPAVEPVPVLVLNNSRIEGLAARAAATFERGGWPVRDTGGLRGRIRATTVYYPPGQEAVARELARRFDGIERVLPRLAGLPGSGLTVVVTRDFRP